MKIEALRAAVTMALAILIVGAGLAVTYVSALLSPGDLHGARLVVAIVFLRGGDAP